MRKIYEKFLTRFSGTWLYDRVSGLYEIEQKQTFTAYQLAAEYTLQLLQSSGVPNARIMHFPANGRTAYQDKKMPLAWDAKVGKLTLLNAQMPYNIPGSNAKSGSGIVVADYQEHPYSLISGSVLPEPEMIVRIMTESQVKAGEDPSGALVILEPFTSPRAKTIKPLLDLGALGIISDYLKGRYQTPDARMWVNACTEGSHWHIEDDDRDFIGFSVPPRTGDMIRFAANQPGELMAKVECDGMRYEGQLPLVTALIPGESSEEIWVLAHLFEPLADDDSAGVINAIASAAQVMMNGRMRYSLRLLFAMEMYGFAAYAATRGDYLHKEVIGAVNLDTPLTTVGGTVNLIPSGPAIPFYGNVPLKLLAESLQGIDPDFNISLAPHGAYGDDQLLSDATVGVPTSWSGGDNAEKLWHNSNQDMAMVSPEMLVKGCALNAAYLQSLVDPDPGMLAYGLKFARQELKAAADEPLALDKCGQLTHLYNLKMAELGDFARFTQPEEVNSAREQLTVYFNELLATLPESSAPQGKWRKYAQSMICCRKTTGFPHDLEKVPKSERFELPDYVIYGPFANVLSNMDGKKDMMQLIAEAEYETGSVFSESTIKRHLTAICRLAEYGYLDLKNSALLTPEALDNALSSLGIKNGDLLFVHSALGAFGQIENGAKGLIDACFRAVGENGTCCFPTFTRPYMFLGNSLNRNYNFRPHDPADPEQIWTGTVPKVLLKEYDNIVRSAHATHSFAGKGALAHRVLDAHGETEPPCCASSPLAQAVELNGKVLHFGSGFNATTYLHCLEDELDLPYLDAAYCAVRDPDGSVRTVRIEKHLPGCRDFYRKDYWNSKFYTRAVARGLEVKTADLGLGKILLVDLKQLRKIGLELLSEDPEVLLCDSNECHFCSKHRKK